MNIAVSVRRFALGVAAALCLLSSAFAGSDYLLEIDDIVGESRIKPGAIDLLAITYDIKSPRDSASGQATGRRGKVSMSDISVMKTLDKASPVLMQSCANGKHFAKAVITCRKAGDKPEEYLKITMEDCLISSYSHTGDAGDDKPMESMSLNFTKITFLYTFQGTGGTPENVSFSWDLATLKK